MEKFEIWAFILLRNFPVVLIIFTGRGGAGNLPLPTVRGGASIPEINITNVHTPNQADQLEKDKAKNSLHSAHMNKRTTR